MVSAGSLLRLKSFDHTALCSADNNEFVILGFFLPNLHELVVVIRNSGVVAFPKLLNTVVNGEKIRQPKCGRNFGVVLFPGWS